MNPITMPVRELKTALAGLGKIISKRTTLPVLSHVRVGRSSDGRVGLAATDLDSAAIFALDEPAPGQPIHFLVPFEDLNNTVKSCGRDDTLIVEPVSKNQVAFKFPVGGQLIEHRCDTLPVEEFPPITEITGEPTPLNENLRRSIHNAMECASTDPARININGAYLDVAKAGGHYVVGTDGRHLFSSNSFELPLKDSVIIPSHRFLGWKEFNSDGDWTLRVKVLEKNDAPRFEIASKHWRFISRSYDGNYPNWRHVVPKSDAYHSTVEIDPVGEVTQIIGRLPDHDSANHGIGVEINNRRVALLARSAADQKPARVELADVRPTGPDVTIWLNRQYLIKALRFGLVRIDIIDPTSPLRFSNGGRQMIVMPIRPEAALHRPAPPPVAPAAAQQPAPPAAEPQQETKPMPEQNGKTHGAQRSTTPAAAPSEKTALEIALAQTEVVRGDFRNAIAGLNKLTESLRLAQREQKTNEKEISSVRQTLRSLQSVRI